MSLENGLIRLWNKLKVQLYTWFGVFHDFVDSWSTSYTESINKEITPKWVANQNSVFDQISNYLHSKNKFQLHFIKVDQKLNAKLTKTGV